MSEPEFTHENIQLVGRHVPDETVPEHDEAGKPLRAFSGFYEVGALIDGVFVPLVRRKAGGLLLDIERQKAAQEQAQGEQPQPATPSQPVEPTAPAQPTPPAAATPAAPAAPEAPAAPPPTPPSQ